jgi:hypothetical protein
LLGVHSRCGLHTTAVFSGNKGKFDRVGAFLALLARILPYYVQTDVPTKSTLTYEETVAQLRERGLPPELIDHMRRAPEADQLWPNENPDPFHMHDVTPRDVLQARLRARRYLE